MKNQKYKIIPVKTGYIKPNEPYDIIIDNAENLLENGDLSRNFRDPHSHSPRQDG